MIIDVCIDTVTSCVNFKPRWMFKSLVANCTFEFVVSVMIDVPMFRKILITYEER